MGDHEDAFCPDCGTNLGPGTFEVMGCLFCDAEFRFDDEREDELDYGEDDD